MKRKELTILLLAIVYVASNRYQVLEEHSSDNKIAPRFKFPNQLHSDVAETAGYSTRLDCIAEGNPTPNITWYKNKVTPIVRSLGALTQGRWSLFLNQLNKEDDGIYTCVICNDLGCIKHEMMLFIRESFHIKPVIEDGYPGNFTVLIHETAIFECPVIAYRKFDVYWMRLSNYVMKEDDFENDPVGNIIMSQNLADTPQQLTIDDVNKEDEGWYACVVKDSFGLSYGYGYLKTLEIESIIKEGYPGNVTAVVNENVTFKCPLLADLKLYFIWMGPSNYSLDILEYYRTVISGVNMKKSQNPEDKEEQLTIYNVTKEDEGWYACVATTGRETNMKQGYLKILESSPRLEVRPGVSMVHIMIAVCFGSVIVAALVVVTTCRKLKREKKRKQLALETARDIIETYWSKIITIEKPHTTNTPEAAGALVLPVIKIEKQKVSEVKRNVSDSKMLSEYELPLDEDWEVPRETVVLGEVLGEGAFGRVVQADCVGILNRCQSTVAVKMLKDGHTDAEMLSLVSEMEIMKVVGKHVNIINLLGCCTQAGPLYVIVEFAPNGNLRDFLRKRRPEIRKEYSNDVLEDRRNLTPQDLVSYAYQVAKGMEYLASRHCIHRDLAARNVLVSENFILKIADFGLAKNIETEYYYRKKTSGKLPVRWMAPESLNSMLFTIQTDVWSFGVLVWEIVTLGATPYQSVQGQYLLQHLKTGHRLEKPPSCRLDLYLLMRECWSFSPKGRPSFTVLVRELDKILRQLTNVEYLDLSPPVSETLQVTETSWLSRNVSPEKESSLLTTDE